MDGPEANEEIAGAPADRLDQLYALVGLNEAEFDRVAVRNATGVDPERSLRWWRAMGFPEIVDGVRAFTTDDLAMVQRLSAVEGAGLLDDEMVLRLARLLGASFSRIADVQVDALDEVLLALGADASREPKDRLTELVDQHDNGVLALLESAMVYVWRRHLVAAIGRSLALDAGSTDLAVGFADISGFSSLVQTLTAHELAAVVDAFEVAAFDVVSAGGGHVVKLIGDEVLFTAPTVTQAVDIAMDLMDRMAQEPTMPQLHCGIAHGPTVDVGGDVFGNTVNLAARLTSVARRSTAVIPREHLADLAEREDLDVRRVRRVYDLKGFGATKVAVVRRRAPGEEGGLRRRRSRDAEDRSSDRRDDLSELEEQ